MAQPAIASKIHQPFNVHGYFSSERPLNLVFIVNDLPDTIYLGIRQIVCFDIRIDIELRQNPIRRCPANTINIRKAYLNAFTSR